MRNPNWPQIGKGLAVLGIVLGVAELFAPRRVAKVTGLRKNTRFLRAFGAREIGSGVAILLRPKLGLWSRVAGDALDLGALGAAMLPANVSKKRRTRLALGTGAVIGVTALDVMAARKASRATVNAELIDA